MGAIIQPLSLLAMIAAGYMLKRTGIFGKRDYHVVQGMVFNLTLPAAIIVSFASNEHRLGLLWVSLFGLLASAIPLFVIYAVTFRKSVRERAFLMLNAGGMNVGNFCLPIVTALMGTGAGINVVMFDIGNSFMMSAGMYVMTTTLLRIQDDGSITTIGDAPVGPRVRLTDPQARRLHRSSSLRKVLRSFYTSISFDVYIVMLVILLAGIAIPAGVKTFLGPIGSANAFCSMLMVGMLMDVPESRHDVRQILDVVSWKLIFAVVFGSIAWFFLPFGYEVRKSILLVCLAPTAVFSILFTERVLGNAKLAGFTLASTCIISLVLMTAANLILQ